VAVNTGLKILVDWVPDMTHVAATILSICFMAVAVAANEYEENWARRDAMV
jgi:hypothetical protein